MSEQLDGRDSCTGDDYDYRRDWIERLLGNANKLAYARQRRLIVERLSPIARLAACLAREERATLDQFHGSQGGGYDSSLEQVEALLKGAWLSQFCSGGQLVSESVACENNLGLPGEMFHLPNEFRVTHEGN